ncbi:MAG: two component transcriptional regulator, LytTR family [Bacteroidetes bacterium]|nr:two component transcriptional regulator, LytTR family [Bacteroidota bacterium]
MITCITIDDEPLALKQLSGFIQKTPFLELKGVFENGQKATEYLQYNHVDLMFVDIQMPGMNGMEFVQSLEVSPEVIFITATRDYAVEGFQVNALDYVLKPIDFESFFKSAERAKHHFELIRNQHDAIQINLNHIFIKADHKIIRLEINKILYIEGMREYVRIHLENQKPIMTLVPMKVIEEKLPKNYFMRVHRSFIVNLEKITTIERNRIIFDKEYIPISEQYRITFQNYINDNFLL